MLYREIKRFHLEKVPLNQETFDELKRRLFLALSKYKSSKKTRIVHKIIENNLFQLYFFNKDISDEVILIFSENNKITLFPINIDLIADYSPDDIVHIADQIILTHRKLKEEKEVLSAHQIYNIEKLNKKLEDLYERYLDAFDYFKIIDILYYGFLKFLAGRIFLTNQKLSKEVLEELSSIIFEIISKIYTKSVKKYLNSYEEKIVKAIAGIYVLSAFKEENSSMILKKIQKIYDEEVFSAIKKIRKVSMKSLDDLIEALFDTEVFKVSKNIFKINLRQILGDKAEYFIQGPANEFIAFLCSLNHKNQLFNALSPNEKKTVRLEELVFNEKGNVILNKLRPML